MATPELTDGLTLEMRLGEIAKGYYAFLKQTHLQDAPLIGMTYLWGMRKEYVAHPLNTEEEQTEILHHLDEWMKETYAAMVAMMPKTPASMSLHVVERL